MSGRFTILPSWVVDDRRLTPSPLLVLLALGTHSNKEGWCFVKRQTIGDRIGMSAGAVTNHLRTLADLGYLEITQQTRPDGGQRENGYRIIFDTPPPGLELDPPSRSGSGPQEEGSLEANDQTPIGFSEPSVELAARRGGGDSAATVFAAWVTSTGRSRTVLDSKRRAKVRDRLREGFTVEDLCLAVTGWQASPHHRGENERSTVYNDFELILRDAAHVERFIEFAQRGPGGQPRGRIDRAVARGGLRAVEDFARLAGAQ